MSLLKKDNSKIEMYRVPTATATIEDRHQYYLQDSYCQCHYQSKHNVQGSYCQCHYCKCEHGQLHCKGHGHSSGGYGDHDDDYDNDEEEEKEKETEEEEENDDEEAEEIEVEDNEDGFGLNDQGWNLREASVSYRIHGHWNFDDSLQILS